MEQQSDENKSEEKMNVEKIYIPGISLPLRVVRLIARTLIESVMMAKCLPGIILPSLNLKLVMMAKCISSSYLPFMNRKLMIDFTSYTLIICELEL